MSDEIRNVYIYDVQAGLWRTPTEGEGEEMINEDVDPMTIFESLKDKAFFSKSKNSSILPIDERLMGISIFLVHSDYVEGAFGAQKTKFSGTHISQNSSGELETQSLSDVAAQGETYEMSYFIYDPKNRILAIERNRDVPYSDTFEKYIREYSRINSLDLQEITLHPRKTASPIDRIMGVESVDKIYIKMPSQSAEKLEGENEITEMLKSIGKSYPSPGVIEINLSSERNKLYRKSVFPQNIIRDFWLENQDNISKMIVNKDQNEQVIFGSYQIIFEIPIEKSAHGKNGTILMKKIKERLKSSGFNRRMYT